MFIVAGASGHVGSIVAKELLSKGEKVKVVLRDARKGATWSTAGAEVATGSLDDRASLVAAMRGGEGLFVLLPSDYTDKEFDGPQDRKIEAISGAVKESKIPHVVLLSSVGADLPSGTGPIKGLHRFENALRATGTKLTAIRAGYFQENVGNVLGAAKQAGIFPSYSPSADYPMPMIATHDIGMLAAESLKARPPKSEIVDLHGPSYSNRQVAEKLGAKLGKTLTIVDVPQSEWVSSLTKVGMPQKVAEAYAEMYGAFASGVVTPKGDRMVQGHTTLDQTLARMLG